MATVTVLGTGSWGTALARSLANAGHKVRAWSKFADEAEKIKTSHRHPNLPGATVPETIEYYTVMESAISGSDAVVIAVPSPFVRQIARQASEYIENQIIVNVAKGLEKNSEKTLSCAIKEEIPNAKVVVLSGPTHAEEVSLDLPTMIVSASEDKQASETVQKIFSTEYLRVYTNSDVLGVEISGAFKNIIALATGIASGLGYGDNTKAAIITRGIAEIKRLGKVLGCKESTFSGLAGIGDLVVTCTSVHSRNNQAGILIGKGKTAQEAIDEVGMVVEAINALPAAVRLAEKCNVDMPIVTAVNEIVSGKIKPKEAVELLMNRKLKDE